MARSDKGDPVILVRRETVPDDIHGMWVAQGVLTATGGMTSHAAVVGRQMGKPSVVGAGELAIDEHARVLKVKDHVVKEGDFISFDGLSGEVKVAKVASQPSEILQVLSGKIKSKQSPIYERFSQLLNWSDKFRRLGVRANADLPDQAEIAYAFGARGIGLCRTEHMFFGEGRIPIVQQMILAETEADRRKALDKLLPLQREDFYGVFKAMHGEAVTIRTIDPPLHEFLPKREELMVELAKLEMGKGKASEIAEKKKLLARVEQLHEFNPMLGHRGVRLGITYPEITEMQTRAIMEAACKVNKEGLKVVPEIMIPLVGHRQRAARSGGGRQSRGRRRDQGAGRQGEVPRRHDDRSAARCHHRRSDCRRSAVLLVRHQRPHADDVRVLARRHRQVPARVSGQEDSRQGSVRDDRHRRRRCARARMGVDLGRKARPNLKIGICGEHGGDAASIHFFEKAGLDYVSASPYRIPVARLAAAQAAMQVKVGD